ncbi:MAG: PA14 domain-containing protein, partial [Planctomycetota bacterium]
MCKTIICLISFVFMLGASGNVSAGIVAHWTFDEGSGTTAFDSSGNSHDGTFNGDPTWAVGQFGGALQLDGSGDYLNCGLIDIDTEVTGGLTVCAWINKSSGGDMKFCSNRQGDNAAGGGFTCTIYNDRMEMDLTNASARNLNRDTDGPTVPADIWVHVAWVYDDVANTFNEYHDGVLADSSTENVSVGVSTQEFRIGADAPGLGRYVNGLIDDLRIYDYALSEQELMGAMQGGGVSYPYASRPNPADGDLHAETWVSLGWTPGDFAVSHDVYLGDNFDDVNEGLVDTFRGNQAVDSTYFVAGFPGYVYPDGLVPGTTYYWRIDEVNEADPNSPWKGDVWNFTIPSNKAYQPVPSDGGKFIDSVNPTLSWTPGFESILHTVYFGDDYDTVATATGGPQQGTITFNPGSLETEKTYYWRVDELGEAGTHKGDVWSFTTAKEGGGVRGDYYTGMNFENFVLTRTDPQIDFNWGNPGGPDPAVGDDNFSARWTGEVEAAFTETYTFYARGDDGVRLWVNGQQLVDAWVDQGATEYSGTIDLVAGQMYSIVMEYYENGGGTTAELRWSSPSTTKNFVPQAALSPPIRASSPNPSNGATGAKMTPILTWGAGDFAASHEVYFGTDANAVKTADKSSPEYKGTKTLGDEIYDPGKLAWFTQYFWRVDEVNAVNSDSPWAGNLWSFTTGDFIVVENFEDYDVNKPIWEYWLDGLGFGTPGLA